MNIKDKYALVTGASTGIGRAIALELAKQGVTMILTARSKDKLEETQRLIENADGKASLYACDLGHRNEVARLIEYTKGITDQLDILVNVAGIWHGKDEVYASIDFENFRQEVIVETLNVGTLAPMLLTHGLIPLMPKGSAITNLSGTFENGAKGWLPYFVSKRAIEDLTVGLAQELEDKGIKVFGISPSDTATEEYKRYFPEDAKGAQTPEDVAKTFIELLDKSRNGDIWILKRDHEPRKDFHF